MVQDQQPRWYIIHTYSGYENSVEKSIRNKIDNNKLQNQIFDIKVLTEEVIEEKNGKRKEVVRKLFPSYVFIKMIYSPEIWYLVTQTEGVTGFVGPQGRPLPLTNEEVKRNGLETVKIEDFNVKVGDEVEIISGALTGFPGKVQSIDTEQEKLKVMVSMFGRDTPVEVDFSNVEKKVTNNDKK